MPRCVTRRRELRRSNYLQTRPKLEQPRLRYSEKEDERVLAHTIPDRELAAQLSRSVQSIQIRRARLKKKLNQNT